MSSLLGKRKRRAQLEAGSEPADPGSNNDFYRKLMQKHFETTYEPLDSQPQSASQSLSADSGSGNSEGSGWEGFSGDDGSSQDEREPVVEVIDHTRIVETVDGDGDDDDGGALNDARRSFMSPKPPSEDIIRAIRTSAKLVAENEDSTSEASMVANDMALRRLLRDSKLLASAGSADGQTSLQLSGQSRHLALDAHMRSLGAKSSVHTQKSMPMMQRKGMTKKADEREETRRKEAREAGIVLERVRHGSTKQKLRERGIGAPGVGKFKGGTLSLSAKDIREIQGPSGGRSKGKRGRR